MKTLHRNLRNLKKYATKSFLFESPISKSEWNSDLDFVGEVEAKELILSQGCKKKSLSLNSQSSLRRKVKKLKYNNNDGGIVKHFTPASQEWYNNIYAYNSNYIKGLSVTDKNLMTLLKGYFSMYLARSVFSESQKGLDSEGEGVHASAENKKLIRQSARKIFIGKGELKHTSNKVLVTFYVYNTEKWSLNKKFILLYKSLFSPKQYEEQSLAALEEQGFVSRLVREQDKGLHQKRIRKYLLGKTPLIKYLAPTSLIYPHKLDKDDNNALVDSLGKQYLGKKIEQLPGEIIYNRPYTSEEFLYSPSNSIHARALSSSELVGSAGLGSGSDSQIHKKGGIVEEANNVQKTFYDGYSSIVESFIYETSTYLKALSRYFVFLTELVNLKVLNNSEKLLIFLKVTKYLNSYSYPDYGYYKDIADKSYNKKLYKLRHLLKFNSVKFEKPFMGKLTHLVEKLYNKKVEFNIVNLKKMHLSSDILTQAIVLKTKQGFSSESEVGTKNSNSYKILESALKKVDIPQVGKGKGSPLLKYTYFLKKIRNSHLKNILNKPSKATKGSLAPSVGNTASGRDSFNKLLLNYFPFPGAGAEGGGNRWINHNHTHSSGPGLGGIGYSLNEESKGKLVSTSFPHKKSQNIRSSLSSNIINKLRYSRLGGIRLEAKGRLSKRFVASRSVFHLYWKGGLKNIDSSFKKLPAVTLRGNEKSNIESSSVNSKLRTGAFGLKGWVSSK